jgi:hypothetical protein
MHDKLNAEIDKLVAEMAPPANAVGLLTAEDVGRIVRQAATRGAMAGWVAGERTARNHWGREIDKLREQIKELEMDQIARAK